MKLTKHLGVNPLTNRRLALIMTVMPGTEDCLVVDTERLPNDLKENFMNILSSDAGQNSQNLADVLTRRLYSDTGKNMLTTLHEHGFITKLSIDAVEMSPSPSYKIPLREVLMASGIIPRSMDTNATKFNPHTFNSQAAKVGESLGTARNLLLEADMLETEAKNKREKAYNFAPSLRPGATAPVDTSEQIDLPFMRPAAPVEAPSATALSAADLVSAFSDPDAPTQ